MKKVYLIFTVAVFAFASCSTVDEEAEMRSKVENYFAAWNKQEFTSEAFRGFTRDTTYTWYSPEKEGEGIRSVFNPNSGWKQWDVAWNGA
ncbi:MAG: hypothetical protein HEP71_06715 [Roseivirga sp.]|nr:hypothetical protein [Roseivirga sp.]